MFEPNLTPFYLLVTSGLFGIICWGIGYEMGKTQKKILNEEITNGKMD